MMGRKLYVLLLSLAFLHATIGLVTGQERKVANPCAANPCAAKPAMKAKTAEGTVKSVSATTLVIEGKDKKEWTFAMSGAVAEAAKKLKAGDTVSISYTEASGKMMAGKITARAATMEKKAVNPCAAKGPSKAPTGANPCAAKK
jgi:ribosomal protein S1